MKTILSLFLLAALSLAAKIAVAEDLGLFGHHGDIGPVKNPGATRYHAPEQTYEIEGSGANMWFDKDEFQFAYRKLSGDFILHARGRWVGEGVDPHRKLGWMIRSSLDANAAYVDVAVHGDGLTSMQFRRSQGANTEEVKSKLSAPDVLQLERRGGKFIMSVATHGETYATEELADVDLGNEVFVGLFVCAHNPSVSEKAIFDNVRICVPAPTEFRPYRDYIGSHLEVMEVATGSRTVVHTVTDSLQAPNWTRDNQALIFNRNGALYRFDLSSQQVTRIDSGFANQNNNDHVVSFAGTQLGISHHTGDKRTSVVYTMPLSGGLPRAVTTPDEHSYLHGWSPDDEHLIYTAQRQGDFDIFRIPAGGGQEVNLTHTSGLDDGAEYAPDGQTIYFNSSRSGRMQIWAMDADGSHQRQVTDDAWNNWFPHVSPDGQSIVMLSFDGSVAPDEHPFYQQVYIRLLERSASGWGKPRVIAYVYGGQGTINVPSWSPDSRRISFVSNSDVAKLSPE